jgi:hypothetical protein
MAGGRSEARPLITGRALAIGGRQEKQVPRDADGPARCRAGNLRSSYHDAEVFLFSSNYEARADALVESPRWFDNNRELLPEMSRAARTNAEHCTWEHYRLRVAEAITPLV